MSITPVNYRKQDASAAAIASDVDYALQIVDFYVQSIPEGAAGLLGRRVLEIGPGFSLGTAVLLACYGAEVTVADRYLASWDADYHKPFLEALLARLAETRRELSPDPILALLETGDFEPTLCNLHLGIEDLEQVEDNSFEVVVSNAVFEHVEDVPRALEILARITVTGGVGIHQVDFRDHRDFGHPLEYLTLDPDAFATLFADHHGECGNRWRHGAMGDQWRTSEFEVVNFDANMFADEDYLDDIIPRLHSDYRSIDREALRVVSGCFIVRRRQPLNTEYPVETDHAQTLAHSRTRYAFAAQFAQDRKVLDLGCGAGVGTRLLSKVAGSVVGVDVRPEALELARADGGENISYRRANLETGVPFKDDEFELIVCLEVLEHVRNQVGLIKEIQRVLTPDGLALISVPNKSFENFWSEMAGEANPYHVSVPDLGEFTELLSEFGWVDFSAQVDVVATVVLPLDGSTPRRQEGSFEVTQPQELSDRGTVTIIATCYRNRPLPHRPAPPIAHTYGNYQAGFGAAIEANQHLTQNLRSSEHESQVVRNALRWAEL